MARFSVKVGDFKRYKYTDYSNILHKKINQTEFGSVRESWRSKMCNPIVVILRSNL